MAPRPTVIAFPASRRRPSVRPAPPRALRRGPSAPWRLLLALAVATAGLAATLVAQAPAVGAIAPAPGPRLGGPAAPPAAGRISGPARVRDGDTIVVGGAPVRLGGLHCPERGEPGGAAATAAMRRLVRRARVECVLTGERTHDRRVGWCAAGGADLGERLIAAGVCTRCARHDPAGRYAAAVRAAAPWRGGAPGYCG